MEKYSLFLQQNSITPEVDPIHRSLEQSRPSSKELWEFIYSQSETLNPQEGKHISGHKDTSVNATSGAFIFMNVFMIVLSTLYLVWRVYYHDDKYLTDSWKKRQSADRDPGLPKYNARYLERSSSIIDAEKIQESMLISKESNPDINTETNLKANKNQKGILKNKEDKNLELSAQLKSNKNHLDPGNIEGSVSFEEGDNGGQILQVNEIEMQVPHPHEESPIEEDDEGDQNQDEDEDGEDEMEEQVGSYEEDNQDGQDNVVHQRDENNYLIVEEGDEDDNDNDNQQQSEEEQSPQQPQNIDPVQKKQQSKLNKRQEQVVELEQLRNPSQQEEVVGLEKPKLRKPSQAQTQSQAQDLISPGSGVLKNQSQEKSLNRSIGRQSKRSKKSEKEGEDEDGSEYIYGSSYEEEEEQEQQQYEPQIENIEKRK